MRRTFAIFAAAISAGNPAGAAEPVALAIAPLTLKITVEALRAPREPSKEVDAALRGNDRIADLLRAPVPAADLVADRCRDPSASLCYDARSRKVIYKPMRSLLPGIPGMTPHNLTLSRNKITASYTFK
jgi:hypothetical protein